MSNVEKTQGDTLKSPSQSFEAQGVDVLLTKVKRDINFILYASKTSVRDFVSHSECIKKRKLLLAVSGGVDSQVMLHCLHQLQSDIACSLHVVTINHNMRDFLETKKDAELVYEYSTNILKIPCKIITIDKNRIKDLSKERKRGIEEAARFERYTKIYEYALSIHADCVFFAHNKNDQLETLVQHFLQGSSAGISGYASSGIRQMLPFPVIQNTKDAPLLLFRPLLNVSREEIELHAQKYTVPFREDSTNAEIVYYRNRIRHTLIPVLNEFFPGWDTGVLHGSEKALQEILFIESLTSKVQWQIKDGIVQLKLDDFFAQGFPVRIRLLYNAIELSGVKDKVSYKVLKACAEGQKKIEGSGLLFFHDHGFLKIQRRKEKRILSESFDIFIESEGTYSTSHGTFDVKLAVQKMIIPADTESGDYYIGSFSLPLRIRNKTSGDKTITAQGTHKSVKKIFSDWHVDLIDRHRIPIIEYGETIVCIWASPYGYKNWYVKQNSNEQRQVYVHFKRNNK